MIRIDWQLEKFATIKWGHHPCGRGSCLENTELTRTLLEEYVSKYNIKTVSDAGAGDLSWINTMKWDVEYTGYDIRQWNPNTVLFDVTKDVLPKTDLIICRHVLNHLDAELAEEARDRFEESKSKYILITCTNGGFRNLVERWGEPLEKEQETFPGGRVWNYGLWVLTPPNN